MTTHRRNNQYQTLSNRKAFFWGSTGIEQTKKERYRTFKTQWRTYSCVCKDKFSDLRYGDDIRRWSDIVLEKGSKEKLRREYLQRDQYEINKESNKNPSFILWKSCVRRWLSSISHTTVKRHLINLISDSTSVTT